MKDPDMLVVERRMVSNIRCSGALWNLFEPSLSALFWGLFQSGSEGLSWMTQWELCWDLPSTQASSILFCTVSFLQVSFSLIQWKRHLVQIWFGMFTWCGLNIVNLKINNENKCWQKKSFYVSTSLNFSCRACLAYERRATQAVITFQ